MKLDQRFIPGITGLSEDMIDYMLEQYSHYKKIFHYFYTSFWKTCTKMWENGIDLTNKQMKVFERDYGIVKKKRINEWELIKSEN